MGGRPGVLSARYGGPTADWAQRRALLLAETTRLPATAGARRVWFCALTGCPDGSQVAARADLDGRIAHEERGDGGFSYDAVFEYADGRTFAELSEVEKNAVSHRACAVAALGAQAQGITAALTASRYEPPSFTSYSPGSNVNTCLPLEGQRHAKRTAFDTGPANERPCQMPV